MKVGAAHTQVTDRANVDANAAMQADKANVDGKYDATVPPNSTAC